MTNEVRPRQRWIARVVVVGTVGVMAVGGPPAHAAERTGGGGTGGVTQAALSAPYEAVEQGYCGPAADRSTGRLFADPLAGPLSCSTPGRVRESASYFGSNQPLRSMRAATATLRIRRAYVPAPGDPFFYAVLAVAPGFTITSDSDRSRFYWCTTAGLLTPSERESRIPVTITNREVTATCWFPDGYSAGSVWAGIALRYSNGVNPVELDATLTSLLVKS